MANKANACVDKESQLQICGLQSGQVLGGYLCIQVSWLDPRILGQVVNNLEEGSVQKRFGLVSKRPSHDKIFDAADLNADHGCFYDEQKSLALWLRCVQVKQTSCRGPALPMRILLSAASLTCSCVEM